MTMSDQDDTPLDGIFVDVFKAEKKPPRWIVKQVLPPGLVLIGGGPKSKKSTIAVALASMVAEVKCEALPPFLRHVNDYGDVVILSAEADAGELRSMLEDGLRVMGVADGRILVAEDPFGFQLDDETGSRELLELLNRRSPKICIIDPFVDFHSLEEKEAGAMVRILRPLRTWAIKNASALILVHHARKPGEMEAGTRRVARPSDLRGSSAIFGKADAVIMCTQQDDGTITLDATFKRGQAWQRTIILNAYDQTAPAREFLRESDFRVMKAIEAGAKNSYEIASAWGKKRGDVLAIIECLKRNELIRFNSENKQWKLTPEGKQVLQHAK